MQPLVIFFEKLSQYLVNNLSIFWIRIASFYRRLFKEQHQLTSKTATDRYPLLFTEVSRVAGDANRTLKLLSFGCSTGEECFSLKKYFPNARIFGADINTLNLAIARRKNISPDITFLYSKPQNLLKTAPYDAVFCLSVLCRWEDTKDLPNCSAIYPFSKFEKTVKELAAMVVKGGLLVIYNSNFRFEDTEAFKDFEIVQSSLPSSGFVHKFDRFNNRLLAEHTHCIYRKLT
ncbi:MAG: methyltransferase domain-containing protein [Cyclobacteriaceae bacterium]|nr:methyltransferase domain-containing protein [Cyclobacteriaceae bacterium]